MPIRINLLAEAQAMEELRRRDPVKRAIWGGFFVVVLVLMWSSFLQAKIITDNSRLSNLESQLSSQTNQYTQIIANRNKLNELNNKLSALSRLATNRFLHATLLDALQQSTVDGIQLVKLHTEQAYEVTAEVKSVTTDSGKTPGHPASSKEKITLLLDAKDTSPNPGGEQIYKFKDSLARTPYFLEQRISTNQIQLKTLATPQLDNESGKAYVTFTLECDFPDRVR
jgi:hypothetical protein